MSEENKAKIEIDFVVNRDEAVQDLQKIKQSREDLGKSAEAAAKREAEAEKATLAAYQERMAA
ncbi:MAG TPA: hypothetical protein VHR72_13450, partial [Gemmataceae bacterium]|nr:hypothetical protein [Gemmataceae bacterium]